jgi:putative flippase GtrA
MNEHQSSKAPAPKPLVLSAAFGGLGVLLFLIGALTSSTPVFVAGFFAGAVSLGVALYWRSELIVAWHEQRDR